VINTVLIAFFMLLLVLLIVHARIGLSGDVTHVSWVITNGAVV
jgi:hypothetical protein